MAKTISMAKRGYPTPRHGDRPEGPPWRCQGCKYIVTEPTRPLCRICRSKGLGAPQEAHSQQEETR